MWRRTPSREWRQSRCGSSDSSLVGDCVVIVEVLVADERGRVVQLDDVWRRVPSREWRQSSSAVAVVVVGVIVEALVGGERGQWCSVMMGMEMKMDKPFIKYFFALPILALLACPPQRRQELLLAKYQMQQGLYSKTLVDNEELAEAARQYAKVCGN